MTDWRREVDLDGEGPVYEQIRRGFEAAIRSGRWTAGHRLPSEAEIGAWADASRMTVNRAMRALSDEGLITRRQGAGSFVATPPAPSAILGIVDMARAIPEGGRTYDYRCLRQEMVQATPGVAERMRLEPGAPLRHIVCLHLADGVPLELEERWIDTELLPSAREMDFAEIGPGSWLLSETPWTEAEHTVRAVDAPPGRARLLQIESEAACLVLERRTFQGDAVVTWARLTHPGDRHVLTERFTP